MPFEKLWFLANLLLMDWSFFFFLKKKGLVILVSLSSILQPHGLMRSSLIEPAH